MASGRSFSPEPNLGLRVDAEAGGLRGSVQEMAGVDQPVCNMLWGRMHFFKTGMGGRRMPFLPGHSFRRF